MLACVLTGLISAYAYNELTTPQSGGSSCSDKKMRGGCGCMRGGSNEMQCVCGKCKCKCDCKKKRVVGPIPSAIRNLSAHSDSQSIDNESIDSELITPELDDYMNIEIPDISDDETSDDEIIEF
jgi:hypothetical protein